MQRSSIRRPRRLDEGAQHIRDLLIEHGGVRLRPGMYQVTQELAFCYGHRLLGHPGKCARLHGHNARAFVVLRAERLDAQGMVADFDAIERRVRAYVEEKVDHRMLLQKDDPVVPALQKLGEPCVALDYPPTAENLARLLYEVVEAAGFPVVEVRLEEQPGSVATFRR